jgi:hypothetical protein
MIGVWNSGQRWGAKGLTYAPAKNTGLNMPLIRISLGFMDMKDTDLDDFVTKVFGKLTANAGSFGVLPVSVTNLGVAQAAFHTSLANAKGGGKAATADKDSKRAAVLALLRPLALAVQGKPGLTLADVDLSGFDAIESGPHTQSLPKTPVILGLTNVASTKLGVKLQGSDGAKAYEIRTIVGNAAPAHAGTFPSTRGIVLEDLIPGTLYSVQVRAVYGNQRYSEWSQPVSQMCT